MIERDITSSLTRLFEQYPFVTVTGPRQSGKTTLCRATFPHLQYVNLEAPDQREFAQSDPRGFLSHIENGAILDEIQRVPDLLSYLQVLADEKGRNGLFILTGSEHFKLSEAITQSLAGRTGLLRLLPFSLAERLRTGASSLADEILYAGFYPRIYDKGIDPHQAYSDYFETYVERDVRRLGEIRNLSSFQRFVKLCAGRIGQLTNLVALGSDAGVSHATARHWLNTLEASFIAFRLPPFHANIRKRLVKTPKLYFYDVGLVSYLVGIERAEQIATHPLRGALFENMVVVELLKHRFNRGRPGNFSFFRDSRGLECDLLFEAAGDMIALEIKSGATVAADFFDSMTAVEQLLPEISRKVVVYGGATRQSRSAGEIVPFGDVCDLLDRFEVDRQIAAFAKENTPPLPNESRVNILDSVYMKHIRPTLDELESALDQQVAPMFSESQAGSWVLSGSRTVNSSSLLDLDHWERTKDRHIVRQGFDLSARRPLTITHKFTLSGYAVPGAPDLTLVVTLSWSFDGEGVSRDVSIDNAPLANLGERILYSDLATRGAKTDRTCSIVLKNIMQAMQTASVIG